MVRISLHPLIPVFPQHPANTQRMGTITTRNSSWPPTRSWWQCTLAFNSSLKSSYSGLRAPYIEPTVRNGTVSSTLCPHPQHDMGLQEWVAKGRGTRSVVRSMIVTSLIRKKAKTNYLHKCAREQDYKVSINKTTDQHRRLSKDTGIAP